MKPIHSGTDRFKVYIQYYEPCFERDFVGDWSVCGDKDAEFCDTCKVSDFCQTAKKFTDDEVEIIKKEHPEYFV
jgi:hypothetical protein